MADRPKIRLATREDVPTILAMIKELAEYEKEPSAVQATESSLLLTLSFAPNPHRHHHHHSDRKSSPHGHNTQPPPDAPLSSTAHSQPTQSSGYAKTLLLTSPDDGEVAAMALYFHNYSTWRAKPGIYLEDLFVRPAYRHRGYGTLLLRELAKEVLRIDGGRLEWSCLRWNEDALRFYEGLGARQMSEWVGLRVDGEELERLARGETEVQKGQKGQKGEGGMGTGEEGGKEGSKRGEEPAEEGREAEVWRDEGAPT